MLDIGCGIPIVSRLWRFDRPPVAWDGEEEEDEELVRARAGVEPAREAACHGKARGFHPPTTVGGSNSFNRMNAASSALPHLISFRTARPRYVLSRYQMPKRTLPC